MSLRVLHWYPNFLRGGAVAAAVHALAESEARAGADPVIVGIATDERPLYGAFDGSGLLVEWQPTWKVAAGGLVTHGISRDTRRALRALRPDIVHMHAEYNPDHHWPLRLFSCPCILSPHGAFNPVVLSRGRPRAKQAYVAAARLLLYRRVTAFHALSPFEVDHIRSATSHPAIYCVPQGPGNAGARAAGPAPSASAAGGATIVSVGRLDVFTKGLDILLEAYARVAAAQPRAIGPLTLVGPDWNGGRAELERRARELGIADRVILPGPVERGDVAGVLDAADIYVQASRNEGFSLAVAEALVAGIPVVMTRGNGAAGFGELTSHPHVRVVDADAAALAAALGTFAADLPAVRRAAEVARPEIADFLSWDRIAHAHLAKYASLVGRPAPETRAEPRRRPDACADGAPSRS
jgi:glycosyltransferase involved in cell wall biosynthesis